MDKKITNEPADGKAFKLGETIEYSITVKNEGNVSYTNVKVEDADTGFTTTIATLSETAGVSTDLFKVARIPGYTGRCSEHARDAAILVFGRK